MGDKVGEKLGEKVGEKTGEGELVVFGSGGGSWWDWFCGGRKVGELCGSFHIAQVSLQLI